MSRLMSALLLLRLSAPALLHAQNVTNTSNGILTTVVSFAVTPGTSNSPTSRTATFRLRCMNAAGYELSASAAYSLTGSSPDDGGRAIAATDIGVGITAIDTSKAGVVKPRTDLIASGFDYDPAAVTAVNGLTPYTGRAGGQATLADLVNSPLLVILTGPQIAANEDTAGAANFITVTMTFALVPQYFTPGTFTATITLAATAMSPEHLADTKTGGAYRHEQEPPDTLSHERLDAARVRADRIRPDERYDNGQRH